MRNPTHGIRRPSVRSRLRFAVLAVALAGCGGPSPAPAVSLRLGFFPSQDFLPYFVMQEQGFARRNGLTFVETPFVGGAAAIDAMVAGSLDVCPGVASVPILAGAERGLIPDKIMPVAANDFADRGHRGAGVVTAASIQSWKDLQGKRIAVNARISINAAGVAGRLKIEGVTEYSFVEIPLANQGLAVAGGNVAAAAMSEPFLTQALLRGDGKLLGWVVGDLPLERAEFTGTVFSGDFYRRHPQAVKAYLRAHLQAVTWINSHLERARAVLARRLELGEEVGRKVNLLSWPEDARHDPALLEGIQPLLLELGVLKSRIPAHRLYDQTLLEEVLAEKGQAR